MLFNSFIFWLIYPFVFVLYWLMPAKFVVLRKCYLLLVSYLFYINLKPVFVLVLLYVTLVTFVGAILLRARQQRARLITNTIFAVLSLLPLLLFKYYDFVNHSICQMLQIAGLYVEFHGLNWAVPVGISFYTFQAVGYLFDVYGRKIEPERNLLDYALFVSFFPQVVSGPISRADELLPQIKRLPRFDLCRGVQGLRFILWGMFLKLVIADRCGIMVDAVFVNMPDYGGATCLFASILFSVQILAILLAICCLRFLDY